jgi:hypothetical protein
MIRAVLPDLAGVVREHGIAPEGSIRQPYGDVVVTSVIAGGLVGGTQDIASTRFSVRGRHVR